MTNKQAPEVAEKLDVLRAYMREKQYDVVRVQTPNLFAWLTGGGRNHIDITSDWTGAALYVTQDRVVCVMANNERDRVETEELTGRIDCEIRTYPWWGWADNEVRDLYEGRRVAGDMAFPNVTPIGEELRGLFYPLGSAEIDRFKALGREVSDCFLALAGTIRPGMTEFEIDGFLSEQFRRRGIHPNVMMVATDERARRYMHPLATDKKLDKYAVISVCGVRGGLVISQTRSFHVGRPDEALLRKHEDAAYIAARLMASTHAGSDLAALFKQALALYEERGWPEEWKKHSLGGKTGYRTREFSVGPNTEGIVTAGTVWGWNPTVDGTKSEDTLLVEDGRTTVLGEDERWPQLSFEANGTVWRRPAIYILDQE